MPDPTVPPSNEGQDPTLPGAVNPDSAGGPPDVNHQATESKNKKSPYAHGLDEGRRRDIAVLHHRAEERGIDLSDADGLDYPELLDLYETRLMEANRPRKGAKSVPETDPETAQWREKLLEKDRQLAEMAAQTALVSEIARHPVTDPADVRILFLDRYKVRPDKNGVVKVYHKDGTLVKNAEYGDATVSEALEQFLNDKPTLLMAPRTSGAPNLGSTAQAVGGNIDDLMNRLIRGG